jgi:hypothetical protein
LYSIHNFGLLLREEGGSQFLLQLPFCVLLSNCAEGRVIDEGVCVCVGEGRDGEERHEKWIPILSSKFHLNIQFGL